MQQKQKLCLGLFTYELSFTRGERRDSKAISNLSGVHSISFLKQPMLWKVKPNSLTC